MRMIIDTRMKVKKKKNKNRKVKAKRKKCEYPINGKKETVKLQN